MDVDEIVKKSRTRRSMPPPETRRLIREEAALTQLDVAQAVGVDPATVCRWESGESSPRAAVFDAYAALLEALKREVLA